MSPTNELEDLEDNCNSNRMVEESENQISIHLTPPNLLKKINFYFSMYASYVYNLYKFLFIMKVKVVSVRSLKN